MRDRQQAQGGFRAEIGLHADIGQAVRRHEPPPIRPCGAKPNRLGDREGGDQPAEVPEKPEVVEDVGRENLNSMTADVNDPHRRLKPAAIAPDNRVEWPLPEPGLRRICVSRHRQGLEDAAGRDSHGPGHHDPVERKDREAGNRQRQENAKGPLPEQFTEATPLADEHREEAAEQEKERHPKAVDHPESAGQPPALPRILHRPGAGEIGHARVHRDA
jgi:hypothetical protein